MGRGTNLFVVLFLVLPLLVLLGTWMLGGGLLLAFLAILLVLLGLLVGLPMIEPA